MTFLHCEFVYALPNEQVEKMPSDRGSNGKGFFLYECKCALNSPEDLNVFGHREQWNGCSSLWILLCIFKFPNWENTFWQKEHWNGFSPLWDSLWIINWEEKVNSFWRKTQRCTLPSFFIFFFWVHLFFSEQLSNQQMQFVNWGTPSKFHYLYHYLDCVLNEIIYKN